MQHRSLKEMRIEFGLSCNARATDTPITSISTITYTASSASTYSTDTAITTSAAFATRAIAAVHASGYASENAWNVCACG